MGLLTLRGFLYGGGIVAIGAFVVFLGGVFILRMLPYVRPFGSLADVYRHGVIELSNSAGPAGRAAFMFVVPGAVLGALVPWLKAPSRFPQVWMLLALVAGLLGAVVSLVGRAPLWAIPLFSGATLVALVILNRSGHAIERHWPVAAFAVALFMASVTVTAHATVGSVLTDLHLFIQKPASPHAQMLAERGKGIRTLDELSQQMAEAKRRADYQSNPSNRYDQELAVQRDETVRVGRALEACLMGGLGFWVTIAALASWRLRDEDGMPARHGGESDA